MKHRNIVKKYGARISAAAAAVAAPLVATTAQAVTDYSSITDAVDWTDVGTALLAVGAAIVGITVVMKGIKLVTRSVKGA